MLLLGWGGLIIHLKLFFFQEKRLTFALFRKEPRCALCAPNKWGILLYSTAAILLNERVSKLRI